VSNANHTIRDRKSYRFDDEKIRDLTVQGNSIPYLVDKENDKNNYIRYI